MRNINKTFTVRQGQGDKFGRNNVTHIYFHFLNLQSFEYFEILIFVLEQNFSVQEDVVVEVDK